MIRTCTVFFCLITLISCGNKSKIPSGVLKPDKMQVVLWDVIRANAFTTDFIKKDSTKNPVEENLKLQQKIFTIHHVTKLDFYKSYDYYKLNPGMLKEMLDSMTSQAKRPKNDIKIKPVRVD
jgi:hypothetical protein